MSRRLPVYLVLDCSESMAGEPLRALESGVQRMVSHLRSDPNALETAWVGVITFSQKAKVLVPLTELTRFLMPPIVMGTGTALGAALTQLETSLTQDFVRSTPERKGDYKPVVIIVTDGEPTDDWEAKADRFKREVSSKRATVLVVGCGDEANPRTLRRLTDQVLLARDLQPETFLSLFRLVSASVATASRALDGRLEIALEKGITHATEADETRRSERDRSIYLHARCMKTRAFYVMRFRKHGKGKETRYEPVGASAVELFDEGEPQSPEELRVSTDQLDGATPCPCCSHPSWARCACGRIHCCPAPTEGRMTLTCPWCGRRGEYQAGTFDVRRGQG